jgi:hypothetical protein
VDLGRPSARTGDARLRATLSDDQVYAVLAYIKSKWPEDILARQTEFSTRAEQQFIEDTDG